MATSRTTTLLLWVRCDGWSAHRCDAPDEPIAAGATIEAVSEALAGLGFARSPVVVALESDRCLVSQFDLATRRQARNREVLNYQVEEPLPVAAEELASDFVVEGVHVLGISARRDEIEKTLKTLATLDVRCVTAIALLAASELSRTGASGDSLWFRPHAIEQLRFVGEKPTAWRTLPVEPDAFRSLIAAQELAGQMAAEPVCLGDPRRIAEFLGDETVSIIECPGDPCLSFAALAAQRIGSGAAQPAFDLRRDPSLSHRAGRSPLRWDQRLLAAASLLLVVAAAGWQLAVAAKAQEQLRQLEAAEAQVFRDVFPDKKVPRGVRTRLESELRSIAGARPDGQATPERGDAAHRLQTLLQSLPEDLRFRLTEVRIEGARVNLLGEARSHADADRIAAAVRRSGLTVAPPSTRQLVDQGVEYRLSAEEPAAIAKGAL